MVFYWLVILMVMDLMRLLFIEMVIGLLILMEMVIGIGLIFGCDLVMIWINWLLEIGMVMVKRILEFLD